MCTISGKSLVDTVVNNLIYKMVESSLTHISDVHGRPLSYGLKSLKDLDTVRGILLRRRVVDYFFTHYFRLLIFKFSNKQI
jgi:hypothetical protein